MIFRAVKIFHVVQWYMNAIINLSKPTNRMYNIKSEP